MSLLFCLLLLIGVGLPSEVAAQSPPDCGFNIVSLGAGVASATLNFTPNGCPNVINWGDGCENNNTGTPVRHRYSACGTYTVTHTVRWNSCFETSTCTQTVTINMAAAEITQSLAQENSDCGVIEKLRATFTPASGCSSVSENVTITGTFPSVQFDVVNNDYSVSGNTVTRVVTAAQINAGTTVELWLRPKYCASGTTGTVALTATAPSMMLSSQNLFCEPPLSGEVTVPLNWTVMPKPACVSISKSALNPSVIPGQPVQYRVTLTNTGTGPVQNVQVKDNFPGDLTPVAASLPPGASVTGNMITWTEASISGGGVRQYDISFTTSEVCPATFTNCAEATACGNKVGPACATASISTGNMLVVQVSGNMYVSNGGTGLPVPVGLPASGSTAPFVLEFEPFSTLTINEPYHFFQGCVFRMRQGAEIIVQGGKQLTLGPQTRMASCDKLWKGIRMENNSSLHMANTYISDAQFAIYVQQNANLFWMVENTFTDNYISVYMPGGGSHALSSSLVFGNKFRGTRPLKDAYAGMSHLPSNAWSYVGMSLDRLTSPLNVSGDNGDKSGLFEGVVYGIRARDCADIMVFGNQFLNLNRSAYAQEPLTYGVFATNGNALRPTIKVTGFGKVNAKLTFDNCSVEVFTSNCHLDKVEQCNMGNTFIGVRAINGRNCNLDIQQNQIASQLYGILIQNSEKARKIRIFHNTVDFPTATIWGQSGIAFFNSSPSLKNADEYHIEKNTVNARYTHFGGIHLSGSFGFNVFDNTINMYQARSETSGINVEGGQGHDLIRNHCFGMDPSMKAEERASGIHTSMSPSTGWCCNDVHGTKNGFFVEGNCAGYFFGNEINDHTYGLRFGSSGIMGGQRFNQGNTWSTTSGSIWEAWHEGGPFVASLSAFKVKQEYPYEPPPIKTDPLSIGGNIKWFAPPLDPNSDPFLCVQSLECEGIDSPPLDPGIDDGVADGTLTIPYHTDGSVWMARRNLYARLSRYPTLVQSGSNMATFFAAQQNAEIGLLDPVERGEEGLFALSASDSASAANYYATVQNLTAQMEAIDTQMVIASAAQQQVLLGQKAALQAQYATNRQSAEAFWSSIWQQMLGTADQLLVQNGNIVTTTLQGANERIWHSIYLSKLVRGDFDLSTGQMSDLESVAYQCPLDGGGVVYSARGALEMVQDTVIAWPNNCGGNNLQGGETEDRVQDQAKIEGYDFSPNPVSTVLLLSLPMCREDIRTVEVFGILGTLSLKVNLPTYAGTTSLDLSHLSSGVYWLIVKEKGKAVFTGKVIKI